MPYPPGKFSHGSEVGKRDRQSCGTYENCWHDFPTRPENSRLWLSWKVRSSGVYRWQSTCAGQFCSCRRYLDWGSVENAALALKRSRTRGSKDQQNMREDTHKRQMWSYSVLEGHSTKFIIGTNLSPNK